MQLKILHTVVSEQKNLVDCVDDVVREMGPEIVRGIMAIMLSSGSGKVKIAGARALRFLCFLDEHREEARNSRGLKELLSMLTYQNEACLTSAIGALEKFLLNGEICFFFVNCCKDLNRELVSELNGVRIITNLIENKYVSVQNATLSLLSVISQNNGNNFKKCRIYQVEKNCKLIGEYTPLKPLLQILHRIEKEKNKKTKKYQKFGLHVLYLICCIGNPTK